MEVLLGAVVGAVVAVAVTALLHPVAERLERASRRLWKVGPLFVHVETDRRVIWAGSPPWIPAAVWVPEMPDEQPPMDANDWSTWARRLGGHDADVTMLEVTLQARKDMSLVIDRPMIRHARSDDRRGVIALCRVGGADLLPRRIEVDLDLFEGDVGVTQHLDYDEEVPWPSYRSRKERSRDCTYGPKPAADFTSGAWSSPSWLTADVKSSPSTTRERRSQRSALTTSLRSFGSTIVGSTSRSSTSEEGPVGTSSVGGALASSWRVPTRDSEGGCRCLAVAFATPWLTEPRLLGNARLCRSARTHR